MGNTKTCLLFVAIQLLCVIAAEEMKRAPSGFVGTRGKKSISEYPSDVNPFYKRNPKFFVGVKGKKNMLEEGAEGPYKRAPMGFVGMRGKKELQPSDSQYAGLIPRLDGSLIGKIDYSANGLRDDGLIAVNNLIAEYLQELETKNAIENELEQEQMINEQQTSDESFENSVDKRAANMHQFYGVRGKKATQNKRPYDLTFRGKFIGVRGKKEVKDNSLDAIKFLLNQEGPWPKRKTQMGFFGMRGKKWDGESSPETEVEVLN